ncbi:MAG: FKBP-type peptidyl-prolyl cis-trans isomerase [Alphaproteobacteria bacterium]|nr:FKBP-type peptidyl-prolyl cis-trans isomerase [Alphaproteobacteria bacterium]
MKRVFAVLTLLLPLAMPVGASAQPPPTTVLAPPTGDALSIENNLKYLEENKKKKGVITRPSGLQFRIIQNGYGKRPQSTDTVKVYYTGTLINHVIFDGTSPGLPASLKLNSVIPGWIEALQLMREGDHWLLTIPPNLGYGVRAQGDIIPPNQVLIFDIRLVETTPAPRRGEKGYIPDASEKEDQ